MQVDWILCINALEEFQYQSMDTHSEAIICRGVWVLNEHRFLARLWYRRGIKRTSIFRVNTHIDFLNVRWIRIQYLPLLIRIQIRQ